MQPISEQFIDELDERLAALNTEGERLIQIIRRKESELNKDRELVEKLRGEYQALIELRRRYRPPVDVSPQGTLAVADNPLGPTDYIFQVLRASPDGRMEKPALVESLVGAINSSRVASATQDPAKLASSLVGNLLQRGRLLTENGLVWIAPGDSGRAK